MLQAFESGVLDLKDFYFTGDDYRYHIEIEAKSRLLGFLKNRFNAGVKYKGKVWKWDTVIEQKTMELARYRTGKSKLPDFSEPRPESERTDSFELRKRILSLSTSEARKIGIGKSTLHYLRRKSSTDRSFTLHCRLQERLQPVPENRPES